MDMMTQGHPNGVLRNTATVPGRAIDTNSYTLRQQCMVQQLWQPGVTHSKTGHSAYGRTHSDLQLCVRCRITFLLLIDWQANHLGKELVSKGSVHFGVWQLGCLLQCTHIWRRLGPNWGRLNMQV